MRIYKTILKRKTVEDGCFSDEMDWCPDSSFKRMIISKRYIWQKEPKRQADEKNYLIHTSHTSYFL